MLKIELNKLDELNEICSELGVLAYLLELVLTDENKIYEKYSRKFNNEANCFLIRKMVKIVLKLKKLTDDKDFVIKV